MSVPDVASPGHAELAAMLAEQRALTQLGLQDLEARWNQQPDRRLLNFGEGLPLEQLVEGNPTSPFHGVAILNPTGRTFTIGFNATAGIGSGLVVPAGQLVVWPASYTNLSIASTEAVPAGPVEAVTILRLRYPPSVPGVYPLDARTASTLRTAAFIEVKTTEAARLVTANANRRGVRISNSGTHPLWLGLGFVPAVGKGLYVENNTYWDGKIGNAVWLGEVQAIAEVGTSFASVLEA